MGPCCELDLEDSKPIFLHDTTTHDEHHLTKYGNKIFGSLEDIKTFIDILNLHCDLDIECSNPTFFSQKTLWFMMMYHQTKFGC